MFTGIGGLSMMVASSLISSHCRHMIDRPHGGASHHLGESPHEQYEDEQNMNEFHDLLIRPIPHQVKEINQAQHLGIRRLAPNPP